MSHYYVAWQAVAAVCGTVIAALVLILSVVWHHQKVRSNEIVIAVNSLREVLLAKLETKERVNELAVQIAKVDAEVDGLLRRNIAAP